MELLVDNPAVDWDKWENVFGIDKDEVPEFVPEDEVKEFEEQNDWDTILNRSKNFIMLSPYGPIPLNSTSNPTNFFNWWVAHTNFPLSTEDLDGINDILGVETFDVFSGYKFRIGIAAMFDDSVIRENVGKYLKGRHKKEKKIVKEA